MNNTLKNLPSLENTIIQKSDKGNFLVLMNHDDYTNRMETLISDLINKDPVNS